MNFKTRPHFEDRQLVQYFGESIKLSGDTLYANTGVVKIEPTILDFTGTTTPVTINGLTGYLNDNNRVSGLVVNPPILKLSGSTGTTTVNVENFVLKAIDSDGTAAWSPISGISWSVSACTSPFLTTDIQPCTPGGTITINAGDLEINNTVRINDGSQSNGYVFTSDGSGNGSWQPSYVFTGNTSGDCITDLYITNLYGCSPITVWDNLQTVGSTASGDYSYAFGFGSTASGNTSFIHSTNSLVTGDRSVVLGGQNITGSTNDTVYTPNLNVSGGYLLHSDNILEITDLGFESGFKGGYTEFNWNGLTSNIISNSNTSGYTSYLLGNFSNFPTQRDYGFISYYNTNHSRIGIPTVTGSGFYRNKLVIKTALDSIGTVFSNDDLVNFWWEIDGESKMILNPNGNLGVALNPNGTEDPTANLQIGGTGTTGTFRYIDGNQSSGYVLTSDSDGNATWQLNGFLYEIGEYVSGEGGVIFHRYLTGGTQEYLVVDTSNLSTGVEYSNLSTTSIGSAARSFWDGLSNSNAIVAQSGHTTSAANLCLTSTNNGKSDWYLPSEGELNLIFDNRYELSKTLTTISGATDINYDRVHWSSTERAATTAYAKSIFGVTSEDKSGNWYVRAIRKFSI